MDDDLEHRLDRLESRLDRLERRQERATALVLLFVVWALVLVSMPLLFSVTERGWEAALFLFVLVFAVGIVLDRTLGSRAES